MLMASAGFDPHQGARFFQRLRVLESEDEELAPYFSAHPICSQRIDCCYASMPDAMQFATESRPLPAMHGHWLGKFEHPNISASPIQFSVFINDIGTGYWEVDLGRVQRKYDIVVTSLPDGSVLLGEVTHQMQMGQMYLLGKVWEHAFQGCYQEQFGLEHRGGVIHQGVLAGCFSAQLFIEGCLPSYSRPRRTVVPPETLPQRRPHFDLDDALAQASEDREHEDSYETQALKHRKMAPPCYGTVELTKSKCDDVAEVMVQNMYFFIDGDDSRKNVTISHNKNIVYVPEGDLPELYRVYKSEVMTKNRHAWGGGRCMSFWKNNSDRVTDE